MTPLTLSKTTMRRYLLGRQGLWRGWRVAGKVGESRSYLIRVDMIL
jgi:hypothetical protein